MEIKIELGHGKGAGSQQFLRLLSGRYGNLLYPRSGFFVELIDRASQLWRYKARIMRTTSDKSADGIPKVDKAGQVVWIDGKKAQVMHNGLHVRYGGYHQHWMAHIIKKLKGHHEPEEEAMFHKVLQTLPDDAVMLEVGSYWAYYSLWFRWGHDGRKNYLIEPNPEKIQIGRDNFALNGLEGDFSQYFMSKSLDTEGFLDWDGTVKADVKPMTVDEFIRQKNIKHLDVLHADIQGAEEDLLLGAEQAMSSKEISHLFISTHQDKHEKCKALLRGYGYRIVFDHDIDASSSADGLIVAEVDPGSREQR
ncbi:FkbM family methyltransferase [cf. Phormidesmis sp. LEGE 11477]|uniref:FkbM family methyltransferase n=1 Tax=cf. Phormidesmis sp. LEGE 11477 TaxID=1828680 RepID=UPI00187F6656|nr:FkbM family methyltransferase [cf. Phormidesmis sp. LEGE 11477]MBE9064844.1 FkbM family methyltransferase [cf. Phormidesmis sp. LEGE 11477]